jgi:hypothetical protein
MKGGITREKTLATIVIKIPKRSFNLYFLKYLFR